MDLEMCANIVQFRYESYLRIVKTTQTFTVHWKGAKF